MFRSPGRSIRKMTSFPRARGDVPEGAPKVELDCWFSPRTRGCSPRGWLPGSPKGVFPAHAGMFRETWWTITFYMNFPRARGDVPLIRATLRLTSKFSPRTRGCSFVGECQGRQHRVFPAHAGMFPNPCGGGGVPTVFPAHAGMFLWR